MGAPILFTPGQKYNRLRLLREAGSRNGSRLVECQCDCGVVCRVPVARVARGQLKSCGCLIREATAARSTKHGLARRRGRLPEYEIWKSMRQRCTNPNVERWPEYGGRGIAYDPAWDDFAVFLADVGRRPSSKHTLDRIDNDGNYEKCNVRWSTLSQQARNKSNTIRVVHEGRSVAVAELAERSVVSMTTLVRRLRRGWSVELATATPPRSHAR